MIEVRGDKYFFRYSENNQIKLMVGYTQSPGIFVVINEDNAASFDLDKNRIMYDYYLRRKGFIDLFNKV